MYSIDSLNSIQNFIETNQDMLPEVFNIKINDIFELDNREVLTIIFKQLFLMIQSFLYLVHLFVEPRGAPVSPTFEDKGNELFQLLLFQLFVSFVKHLKSNRKVLRSSKIHTKDS